MPTNLGKVTRYRSEPRPRVSASPETVERIVFWGFMAAAALFGLLYGLGETDWLATFAGEWSR